MAGRKGVESRKLVQNNTKPISHEPIGFLTIAKDRFGFEWLSTSPYSWFSEGKSLWYPYNGSHKRTPSFYYITTITQKV